MIGQLKRWVKRRQIAARIERRERMEAFRAACRRKDTRAQPEAEEAFRTATERALRMGV